MVDPNAGMSAHTTAPSVHTPHATLTLNAPLHLGHPMFEHEIFQHPVLKQLLSDTRLVALVAGLIVILLVFACFPTSRGKARRSGTPTVLLVGPPDSGKTSLFTKLAQDERPATHTSLVPSSATISLPDSNKAVRVVDLAGHARLRDQVGQHVHAADAVVFVVDVVALVRNAAAVAEELPPLLTQMAGAASRRGLSAPAPRLLICAHKADLLTRSTDTASPPDISPQVKTTAHERVRSILTREMDRLKAARGAGGVGGRIEGMSKVQSGQASFFARLFGGGGGAAQEGAAEDDEALIWGGAGPFRWEDVEGVEVEWGASALGPAEAEGLKREERRGNGLDEITEFMWGL